MQDYLFIQIRGGSSRQTQIIKKIWGISPTQMKVKILDGENTDVILVDLSHAYLSYYSNPDSSFVRETSRSHTESTLYFRISQKRNESLVRNSLFGTGLLWKMEDEDDTDEQPTKFLYFPPLETFEEFKERVQPRITGIANRLVIGFPHNLVHFSAKSEDMCNDVGNHENVQRYDYAINSIKLYLGYIQRMVDQYTEYNLETQNTIETMVKELEDVTPDTIHDMPILFNRADFNAWAEAYSNRRVHAGMDLTTGLPKRLVYDINSQEHNKIPADSEIGAGDVDHTKALAEYHELSATCFDAALRAEHVELLTRLEVEPQEYTPDFRNTNLATLDIQAPGVGNIGFMPTFDPNITEYNLDDNRILTSDTDRIVVATAENSGATVTGTGTLGDLLADPIPTGENVLTVTVTSSDGHATKNYTITFNVS